MDIDLTSLGDGQQTSYWFEYDEDDNPDPAKRLQLEVIARTPLIDEECYEKSMPKQIQVNGRMRRGRNIEMPRQNFHRYQRLIFQRCVKDWKNLNHKHTGEPIPCTEETKAFVSENLNGILQFGYDMAVMLGDMGVEQVEKERARFRSLDEVSPGSPGPEL